MIEKSKNRVMPFALARSSCLERWRRSLDASRRGQPKKPVSR